MLLEFFRDPAIKFAVTVVCTTAEDASVPCVLVGMHDGAVLVCDEHGGIKRLLHVQHLAEISGCDEFPPMSAPPSGGAAPSPRVWLRLRPRREHDVLLRLSPEDAIECSGLGSAATPIPRTGATTSVISAGVLSAIAEMQRACGGGGPDFSDVPPSALGAWLREARLDEGPAFAPPRRPAAANTHTLYTPTLMNTLPEGPDVAPAQAYDVAAAAATPLQTIHASPMFLEMLRRAYESAGPAASAPMAPGDAVVWVVDASTVDEPDAHCLVVSAHFFAAFRKAYAANVRLTVEVVPLASSRTLPQGVRFEATPLFFEFATRRLAPVVVPNPAHPGSGYGSATFTSVAGRANTTDGGAVEGSNTVCVALEGRPAICVPAPEWNRVVVEWDSMMRRTAQGARVRGMLPSAAAVKGLAPIADPTQGPPTGTSYWGQFVREYARPLHR
jgi:hypothetical protein